jgi:hypothetical protein
MCNRGQFTVRPLGIGLGLALALVAGQAQIIYSRADVPEAIGDSFVYKYTTTLAPITVGAPGGPQTWDFDTSTYVGELTNMIVVDIAATPFQGVFPTANLVHCGAPPGWPNRSLVFHELSDDALVRIGQGTWTPETTTSVVYDPDHLVHPLPLSYGDEWWSEFGAVSGGGPIRIVMYTWGRPRVDAWGTVNTPAGSFECLRVNSYDSTATETYINDTLINTDTIGYRSYMWIAPNRGVVVFATGPENDTTLEFTETICYRVMVAAASGVAESRLTEATRSVLGVAPNPCVDRATFILTAERPGPISVRICDGAGRQVNELPGRADARGFCRLSWDARDRMGRRVRPGVYFASRTSAGRPLKLVVAE